MCYTASQRVCSVCWHVVQAYMRAYAGPPPPSGTTQSMFCEGHLMSHVLQWMQFCALIWSGPAAGSGLVLGPVCRALGARSLHSTLHSTHARTHARKHAQLG